MSIVININSARPISQSPAPLRSAPAAPAPQPQALARDSVAFSKRSESFAAAAELSTFRIARIRAVSAEIAAGTYDTQARLDATVTRLLDVLG